MKEDTRIVRGGGAMPAAGKPVNPPIERASTILMPDAATLYTDASKSVVYGTNPHHPGAPPPVAWR